MGRNRALEHPKKYPSGIEVRDWGDGYKTIRIHFQYRGMRCRESLKLTATASNIKYAVNLRGEILNAIARDTFNYAAYFPNSTKAKKFGYKLLSDITIGGMLEDYLKQAERTLEYSTFYGYYKKTHHHLLPVFGTVLVRELTAAMIREWIKNLKLTAKTVSSILTPLRAVIETALVDEIIDKNPLDKIILQRLLDKKTSKSDYVVDPFDKKEIEAILSTAEEQIKNFFQFAFFTGLRTSELIALEWGDVDWVNGQIRISRAVVCERVKNTKTVSGERDVLLLPPALEALKSQKVYTFLEGKRIFHYPRKNIPWENPYRIRQQAWVPLLKKAGVRYRNPYQTRHTYASMMLSNGENIMWVAKQMGHINTEMVIKTYGRWVPDRSITSGYRPVTDWDQYFHADESVLKSAHY